jgi:hypothetical protein
MTGLINERRMQSLPKQQAFWLDCPYDAAGFLLRLSLFCANSKLWLRENTMMISVVIMI